MAATMTEHFNSIEPARANGIHDPEIAGLWPEVRKSLARDVASGKAATVPEAFAKRKAAGKIDERCYAPSTAPNDDPQTESGETPRPNGNGDAVPAAEPAAPATASRPAKLTSEQRAYIKKRLADTATPSPEPGPAGTLQIEDDRPVRSPAPSAPPSHFQERLRDIGAADAPTIQPAAAAEQVSKDSDTADGNPQQPWMLDERLGGMSPTARRKSWEASQRRRAEDATADSEPQDRARGADNQAGQGDLRDKSDGQRSDWDKEVEKIAKGINPSPYIWRPSKLIPRRAHIYGKHLTRKYVSMSVGQPGVGKSSIIRTDKVAMVTGKPLLGIRPNGLLRAWYWNGEDTLDEMERGIAAVLNCFRIEPGDIGDRLFLDSGRDQKIIIAREMRDGTKIAVPVVDALIAKLRASRIDVFTIDPFVSSHGVPENNNNAIDIVSKMWAHIADRADCAIELIHHVRKTYGAEVTLEDARGASAGVATIRSGRAINTMPKEEAARYGLESHRQYLREDYGKTTFAKATEKIVWRQLKSVSLENGDPDAPSWDEYRQADWIGVAVQWTPPDLMAGVTVDHLHTVREKVREGRYRKSAQANDWVGYMVAEVMGLDLETPKDLAVVKASLKAWFASKALIVIKEKDGNRNERPFVAAGALPDV
jgi:hypothetical protein